MFDVTTYGAVGDGVADDRPSIQDAIDAASVSGGLVYFPKGTYLLGSLTDVLGYALLIDSDNVFLEGQGAGVSILRMGDNVSGTINFQGINGGGISKLEIDGNRANQIGGHGLRAGGNISNWTCDNLYIHDTYSYGIGLEFDTVGGVEQNAVYKNVTLSNLVINNTGLDGIDIKNNGDANIGNIMQNIRISNPALRSDTTGQTCIDIRGIWQVSNIVCTNWSNHCQSGIRFRPGETTDAAGTGGHLSTLTNFYCQADSTSGTIGVMIGGYQVAVAGGTVQGCENGVYVNQQEATVSSVIAKGCTIGFYADTSTEVSQADRTVFSGCIARGCTTGFKIYTVNCVLDGIVARSNTNGVDLRTGSSGTAISGVASGNSSNNLNKQTTGITWTDGGFIH